MVTTEEIDQLQYIGVTENIIMTAIYPYEADKLLRTFETSTMSCIALPDELFFVDCGAITSYAKKFRLDMEKHFDRPTTHLLLTHDHWHSNFAMEAFKDVTSVISSAGKSYYRKNLRSGVYASYKERIMQYMPDDEKLRDSLLEAQLFIPGIGVSKEKSFGPIANQVIFKVTGGHTKPSANIYVPSEKTLFTGGNLNTCYAQFIWPVSTIDVYKEWEKMDIDHVVPGHGPAVGKGYITLIRTWYEELLDVLRELKKQGLSKQQVVKHPDLPEYPGKDQKSWIDGSQYHTRAVENIIKYWYGQVLKEAREEDLMFIS